MSTPTPELLTALSTMIADALKQSMGNITQQIVADVTNSQEKLPSSSKIPAFAINEYRSSDGVPVADYFDRFEWALQLSQVPENLFGNYARVYMGSELNNALRFLVSPDDPTKTCYSALRSTLIQHFDRTKNKFVESIKFRKITQNKDESIAQFILRLKQGAANCDYGEFLDRMLIEQLLHGLEARYMCDAIIAKNPETFSAACEIAHTLEVTRNTTQEVGAGIPDENKSAEGLYKLGYETTKTKKNVHPTSQQRFNMQHKQQQDSMKQFGSCNGCGGQHMRHQCKFREARCNTCRKIGHIARVCRSNRTNRQDGDTRQVTEEDSPASEMDSIQTLNQVGDPFVNRKKILDVTINGKALQMELDTGAPCGIVPESKLRQILPKFSLLPTDRQFSSYTGHHISCLGRLPVNVSIGSTHRRLNLYVVSGETDPLFGREWIAHFINEIDINRMFIPNHSCNSISESDVTLKQKAELEKLLDNFRDVFSDVPGKLVGPPAQVHLKPGATPIFAKARDVPYALRERYAAEIDRKIAAGFYERVDCSEWASPTHIVVKKNGNLRITGNYKPTVNPRMIIDEHPIPKVETIFNKLKGASFFSHLDLTDAYTHLPIDNEFRHVLTLNTVTHGLIRPTRAVYGAANIPAIWQRRMESILQGLENVVNFYDDIIVAAESFSEHLKALTKTLERLKDMGLRLNRDKCILAVPSLECLGHRIDKHGLHKSDKHIEAIRDAPRPETREDLQLFLGKATYYSAFIPNLSCRARSLRELVSGTKLHTNADYCSRIPRKPCIIKGSEVTCILDDPGDEFEQFTYHQINQLPVRANVIARETKKDPHLGKIVQELELGKDLTRAGYKAPESKYTIVAGCLLFEHRVVIPTVLRKAILNDLHVAHFGMYRKIPHCETGESPASLFLGRNIRTTLDLIRPQNVKTTTAEKQLSFFDPSFRSFEPGQTVYTLSGNARMDKWIRGVIFARIGDLHYEIIYNGKHLKRHIDQIRSFVDDNNNNNNSHLYAPTSVTFPEPARSAETPRK
uniref:Reverse transcriptase domain-containing protein n=1 Tax=Anopheles epiroticus TaxID=199890 RepID=A0A182PBU3_9DIPT